ncbi:MAG: efflux transporter outer membrane subunit [Simkaniaceae bacterium]|nr:efflux transporter outer membrane subunit [Simkaniaceae bacterium]
MNKFSFFLLILTACTMHPKYERPDVEVPITWRLTTEENTSLAHLYWWKAFGDPYLDSLIQESLMNNQDLQVAVSRVDAFAARLGIVASELYPQLSGSGEAGRGKASTNLIPLIPGQSATANVFTLILNASYQVDIWGKIRSATQAAQAQLFSQIENRRTVVLTLISNVAATYIRLKQFDRQLLIANETLGTRKQSYELAIVRYQLGLTSRMEVDQALSEVEDAEIIVHQIQIQIAFAEDLISVLIGKPSMAIERGKTLSELKMPLAVPVALPSEILSQRPDILSAEQLLIAANAEIGVAKARFFPNINLTGAWGVESQQLSTLFKGPSTMYDYGTQIFQEIFTGGRLTSGLKLTRAEKLMALHTYHQTILTAFQEVNDALISHRITMDLLITQKERVETLADYLHLSNLRYQNGETDYLTFLDAERQLFRAELDLAETQGRAFTTLIDIYEALGGGWVLDADQTVQPSPL